MNKIKTAILKQNKQNIIYNRNSLLYTGALKNTENLAPGDIVKIITENNQTVGYGFYFGGKNIAIHVFEYTNKDLDVLKYKYWKEKIFNAFNYRKKIIPPNTNLFRLIHSEGDNLPGLTTDIYNDTAVIEFKIPGIEKIQNFIFSALNELGYKHIFIKKSFSQSLDKQWITHHRHLPIPVLEYNKKFLVDVENGQKTGFFIDQRENRKLIEKYAKNSLILNLFSYTGAFSIYALYFGAKETHNVDISKNALTLAEQIAKINNFNEYIHKNIQENAFDFLNKMPENYYDLIVIDPPAFAKNDKAIEQAIKGYKELNLKAIKKIKKNGIIFTFSCSQKIDKQTFRKIIFMASADSKRNVKIIHQLNQSPDHPIDIYQPKSEYLKGFVLLVN